MVVLQTERLTITELSHQDVGFIKRLVNEPAFLQYIGDKEVHDDESAKRYLDLGPLASYRENGFGLYRVALTGCDTPVGMVGLMKRDYLEICDLGFAFLSEFCSKGYGHESALAIIDQTANELCQTKLAALTAVDNQASLALLFKLGFSLVEGGEKPHLSELEGANFLLKEL